MKQDRQPLTTGQSIRILNLRAVMLKTSLGKTALYSLIARGQFPRQILLAEGGKKVGWSEAEVDAYLRARMAARDHGTSRHQEPSSTQQQLEE